MSSLGSPPLGTDLSATKAPKLIAAFSISWGFGVIFICLRVLSRKLTKNRLWLDDWLIIASLLWSGAFLFDVTYWMVKYGFGRHIWVSPLEATKVWAKGLFIAEFTYTLSLVFIKWSILAFYWRIFGVISTIRLPIWILFGIVCAWGIAKILVTIFQCLPVYAYWERFDPFHPMPESDYSCGVNVHQFFIGNAIPNIVTDIIIMLLPLPYIWKLRLQRAQKVAITSIFVVGIFVTVVSAVRLTFVLNLDLTSPDVTWNESDEMMWTGIEVNIATVCACLPSLKPILHFLMYGTFNSVAQSSGTLGHSRSRTLGRPVEAYGMNYGLDHSVSTTYVRTLKRCVIDDTHPFAKLADTNSEAVELDSIEENVNNAGRGGSEGIVVTKSFEVRHNAVVSS